MVFHLGLHLPNLSFIKEPYQLDCFLFIQIKQCYNTIFGGMPAKVFILVILLTCSYLCLSYTAEKVSSHFRDYDLDKNGELERQQFINKLREDDADYQMNEDVDYYQEITELLYDQYDKDFNGALNMLEWQQFSQDIMDEESPQYQQIKLDPKLKQPQL